MDVPHWKKNFRRVMRLVDDQNKVPIELTNTTGTYLHHINDDCLLEIFSVKSLTPLDLCSLAESCTRFQKIAKRVFPKKEIEIRTNSYYELELSEVERTSCMGLNYGRQTKIFMEFKIENDDKRDYDVKFSNSWHGSSARDIERIFKNFGSILSAISIFPLYTFMKQTNERSKFVLNLVATYCVDTLESLKIHGTIPDSNQVVDLVRRLINLEELIILDAFGKWTIFNRSVLDEPTFLKIVNVVKARPNVLKLKCIFNFWYNCDENQKVRLIRPR